MKRRWPSWQRCSRSGGAARGQGGLSAEHRRRVLDYCQERLSEKIGLQDLAALCGLSRFQFLRRFAHSFG